MAKNFLFISKNTLPTLTTFTLQVGLVTGTTGKVIACEPSFGVLANDRV
jgi:hypothetical protein